MGVSDLVPALSFDLEDKYPHISYNIVTMWGSQECLEYIESLLVHEPTPERPYRQGFSLETILDIESIYLFHQEKFPYIMSRKLKDVKNNPWRGR